MPEYGNSASKAEALHDGQESADTQNGASPAEAPGRGVERRLARSEAMNHRALTTLFVSSAILLGTLRPVGAVQATGPAQKGSATRTPLIRAQVTSNRGNTNAVVAGQTLDSTGAPLPFASIRIRNLDTGAIVQRSTSSYLGEFSFVVPGGSTYVVELVDKRTGQVLAVGPAVTVNAGEAVGVIVKLPAKLPTLAGFFGNAAGAILSAAAAAGITAVTATGDPVTPEQ
jgi:hypothetical protein